METLEKTSITVQTKVNAPIEKVWKYWTSPADIMKWNNASDDWHTPQAENDLRSGGKFNYRMEAKDGSMGFDFWGIYTDVIINSQMDYTLGDGRIVTLLFFKVDNETEIVETFEAEDTNSIEMQQFGWQSILNNFKKYIENTEEK
jgi:uncharacterized protein YndB with AHSA1/START domain